MGRDVECSVACLLTLHRSSDASSTDSSISLRSDERGLTTQLSATGSSATFVPDKKVAPDDKLPDDKLPSHMLPNYKLLNYKVPKLPDHKVPKLPYHMVAGKKLPSKKVPEPAAGARDGEQMVRIAAPATVKVTGKTPPPLPLQREKTLQEITAALEASEKWLVVMPHTGGRTETYG